MRRTSPALALAIVLFCSVTPALDAKTLLTVVGGRVEDGRPAAQARLALPKDVTLDAAGNFYIADSDHHRVRRVDAVTGIITTVAGNGQTAFAGDGGPATDAAVGFPDDIAFDAQGNLYISQGDRIRKVDAATRIITTVAGNGGFGSGGDGGPATATRISAEGMAFDAAGNLYIAEAVEHRVRKVSAATGVITTVAGTGTVGFSGDGGPATTALLRFPYDVVVDSAGNLYIADTFNHRIRKVLAATQTIVTVVGSVQGFAGDGGPAISANLRQPNGIVLDAAGNLFIADTNNGRIRRVNAATQTITTVAGNGSFGVSGDGGPASAAGMVRPEKVAVDAGGNLFINDTIGLIRRVDAGSGLIETVAGGTSGNAGDGGVASSAILLYPQGVVFDAAGNMLIADTANHRIRRVDAVTRVVTTIAGNGISGFSGDGGLATAASLSFPTDIAVDAAGNIYFTEARRVRKIAAGSGIITTVAGTGNDGFSGDGGPATAADFRFGIRLAVDGAGNLYIADPGNLRVRKVSAATQVITTVAGNGQNGSSADGGPATSASISPAAVGVDSAGNLYIVDDHRIRRVDAATQIISTVAGTVQPGFSGDGGPAIAATLTSPNAVTVDAAGNIYISDRGSKHIRKVDGITRIISTIAGNGVSGFAGDSVPAATSLGSVGAIAIDAKGRVVLADSPNHRIRVLTDSRSRAVRR